MLYTFYSEADGSQKLAEIKPKGYLTWKEFQALHPKKYFAIVGGNKAELVLWKNGEYIPSNPAMIEMQSAPVGDYYIAQADGTWLCNMPKAKQAKRAEIADKRWQFETSGMPFGDSTIKTDRESVALLKGAYDEAIANPDYTVNWKAEEGFVTLNAEQIKTIYQRVRAHVQSAFDAEMRLVALIDEATTDAELEEIQWVDPNSNEGGE